MTDATRRPVLVVSGLKVTQPIPAGALPRDLVPPEPAPAKDVAIDIRLEGTDLRIGATIGGRNLRKSLKAIAAAGEANVVVLLNGTIGPGPAPGGAPLVLGGANVSVQVKAPKANG